MRSRIGEFLVCLLLAACFERDAAADDLRLQWNFCGDPGSSLEQFSCDTDFAGHALIATCVTPVDLDSLIRLEFEIEIVFPSVSEVPQWWRLSPADSCRAGPLRVTRLTPTPGPTYCEDQYFRTPNSTFALISYEAGIGAPNRLRVNYSASIPPSDVRWLPAGSEIAAARFFVGNLGTVADDCGGCEVPAGLRLTSVTIIQSPGATPQTLTLTGSGQRSLAGWQCPYVDGVPDPVVSCETTGQRKSWGEIKASYRRTH
jgi:hypothetical protein